MTRSLIALASLAGFAAWLYLRRSDAVTSAEGEVSQDDSSPLDIELPNVFNQVKDMIAPTDEDQAAANEAAFLMMIRTAEGTAGPNGYRTLFGGQLFNDYSDHPRQAKRYGQLWTSAAGAYQLMAISAIPGGGQTSVNTWDVLKRRLGLADFSPESQDAAALELINEKGALGDVRAGRFDQAVYKVRKIWASLPGAGYGQGERSPDFVRTAYLNAGGTLA